MLLCYSTRNGENGEWSLPAPSGLADIHSNTNAGSLPDGRVYLLHNPIVGIDDSSSYHLLPPKLPSSPPAPATTVKALSRRPLCCSKPRELS